MGQRRQGRIAHRRECILSCNHAPAPPRSPTAVGDGLQASYRVRKPPDGNLGDEGSYRCQREKDPYLLHTGAELLDMQRLEWPATKKGKADQSPCDLEN